MALFDRAISTESPNLFDPHHTTPQYVHLEIIETFRCNNMSTFMEEFVLIS